MNEEKKPKTRSKIVEAYERKKELAKSQTYDPDASGSCSSHTGQADSGPFDFVFESIKPLITQHTADLISEAMEKMEKEKVTTTTQADGYVSIKTAAELNDVCEKTIRNKIKDGMLKPYHMGRHIRLKRADVLSLPKLMEKKEKPEDK